MKRTSISSIEHTSLLNKDKRSCLWISDSIIVQCLVVFVGAATISFCVWSPEHSTHDYDKLFRIMYLYDPRACGYNLRASRSIRNLQFNNQTSINNIRPIQWMPAIVTVSTRVSAKTRKYIRLSAIIHIFWFLIAILLRIVRFTTQVRLLKLFLAIVFYATVSVIIFDLSMAIVYIAHIQQSLTKGMILRYSGWSVEMKIQKYDEFGGWLPMVASICWMRGVIVLGLNIYSCRVLRLIRGRVRKGEEKQRLVLEEHDPIPEPHYENPHDAIICVAFSWWTLGCRFAPRSSELHEVTLMKLLYLYDPEACGRIYFYNVTIKAKDLSHSSVMWPVKNDVAADFRAKVKLWLALHVCWLALGAATLTHGSRPCGFYGMVVPFTLTGLALLVVDIIYTGLFLKNIEFTATEVSILHHLNSYPGSVRWMTHSEMRASKNEDTAWISLIFAYCSCRGIVLWIINFWLIKDMYFKGLEDYNRLEKEKSRLRSKV